MPGYANGEGCAGVVTDLWLVLSSLGDGCGWDRLEPSTLPLLLDLLLGHTTCHPHKEGTFSLLHPSKPSGPAQRGEEAEQQPDVCAPELLVHGGRRPAAKGPRAETPADTDGVLPLVRAEEGECQQPGGGGKVEVVGG